MKKKSILTAQKICGRPNCKTHYINKIKEFKSNKRSQYRIHIDYNGSKPQP